MFLNQTLLLLIIKSFPRIRGDVPALESRKAQAQLFSPHTRGCSDVEIESMARGEVFPAYAGMFPNNLTTIAVAQCFPRIRGDVPQWA